MNEEDICVTRSEQYATYRQIITPNGTGTAQDIFAALVEVYRVNRITGQIVINFNQGGARNFIADQVAKVREGSEADTALEHLFGK
jgi:hypothetical protein